MNKKLIPWVGSSVVAEAGAVACFYAAQHWIWLLLAVASHLAAALLCLRAARARSALSQVEQDIVLATAFFLPVWGPCLSWSLTGSRPSPRSPPAANAATSAENTAHPPAQPASSPASKSTFERYEDHVRPQVPHFQRSLFTGHFDRDLARELDTESYAEVLRRGSTDQKRNALSRLADLGEPRHLELVRTCLLDSSHEVRLYAYAELERVAASYENVIAARGKELEKDRARPEATLALAEAHYRYGSSAVLDPEMAGYHFRLALDSLAGFAGWPTPQPFVLRALCQLGLRDLKAARSELDMVPGEHQAHSEIAIARALLAYLERDFKAAREQASVVKQAGAELPDWLKALLEGASATGGTADAGTESLQHRSLAAWYRQDPRPAATVPEPETARRAAPSAAGRAAPDADEEALNEALALVLVERHLPQERLHPQRQLPSGAEDLPIRRRGP